VKEFLKFTIVWISQNLSIPFWMVGHVHLMSNVYEDIYEIIASLGMNLIVAIGFLIDYKQQIKKNKLCQSQETEKITRKKLRHVMKKLNQKEKRCKTST
jgi:hypothetical protein